MALKPFKAQKGLEIYDPSVTGTSPDKNHVVIASQEAVNDFYNPTTNATLNDVFEWYPNLDQGSLIENIWTTDARNTGLFVYDTTTGSEKIESLTFVSGATAATDGWYMTTLDGPRRVAHEILEGDSNSVPIRALTLKVDDGVTSYGLISSDSVTDFFTGDEILNGSLLSQVDSTTGSGVTTTWNDSTVIIKNAANSSNFTIENNVITAKSSGVIEQVVINADGNAKFAGYVQSQGTTSPSDINLKENIKNIDNALDKVQKLNGVEFDWIEDKTHDVGVIAQTVQQVQPELVHDNGEHLTVDYAKMNAILIEAIKELKSELDDIKRQLK